MKLLTKEVSHKLVSAFVRKIRQEIESGWRYGADGFEENKILEEENLTGLHCSLTLLKKVRR